MPRSYNQTITSTVTILSQKTFMLLEDYDVTEAYGVSFHYYLQVISTGLNFFIP